MPSKDKRRVSGVIVFLVVARRFVNEKMNELHFIDLAATYSPAS